MSQRYQHQLEEDNISIQIDPSIFDKPDSQLTQQLYQMARRIAESDRNNQALRQAKKSKSFQLQTLKCSKKQLQSELQLLEQQLVKKKAIENQNNFSKNNRIKYQQINDQCQSVITMEKQIQKNTCQVIKQNQKLQKKLSVLQVQYEIMLKQNKYKSSVLDKITKQKQQKLQLTKINQQKIIELEQKCQSTKRRAQDLQNQLKQQLKNEQQLQELIKIRELQLQSQRKQRQQSFKKQQENKRTINKMMNTAKMLQNQIQCKVKEGEKLQSIHESLKGKISTMEQQQRKLEQLILNRKNIINSLKNTSQKLIKQEQSFNKFKINTKSSSNSRQEQ